jgi:succinoglycan biosynthesis transport protein ExoP
LRQTETRISKRPDVSYEADSQSGLSLPEMIRPLRAHKWFILTCALVCLLGSALYALLKTPVYEAMATIRVDPGRAGSLGLNDLVAAPLADSGSAVSTEIAVIKSDGVAIRTLNSLTDEEFRAYTGFPKDQAAIPLYSDVLSAPQENLIALLKASTTVKPEEGTQLVDISFRDTNPQVAAMMVNHIVAAYTLQNFVSRVNSASQLRTWLSAQMTGLKQQVEASQEKLAAFQEANNIIGTADTSNTTTDRLKQLNDALTAAQSARITKEAQMRAAMTGNAAALASLFPNPKLQSLQAEQGTLYAQYAQLSTRFGAKYSPLVEIKKQMQEIDAEIARDVDSVRNRLREEYAASLNTQNMLQHEYDEQTSVAYAFNRHQAEYAVLKGDVASKRELYDTLQRKVQQAGVDAQVNGVNTMVVDRARAPVRPIEPKKTLIVVSGLILGLFAGVTAAFVFETNFDGLQDIERIERLTGYPVLATIPPAKSPLNVTRREASTSIVSARQAVVTLSSPFSQNAEAYRSLRNALLSLRSGLPKTILFTSALPVKGLAEAAVNFALSLAQAGSRVLLVDADLRQPVLHEMFAVDNNIGLGNSLLGDPIGNCPRQPLKDEKDLYLVTGGERPPFPAEQLGSATFRSLMLNWTAMYDYVVLRAAPLLVVSDALPLAGWADATVLVTKYKVTRLGEISKVQRMLAQTNARVAGLLINDVPSSLGVYDNYEGYEKGYYV